MHIPDGFLSTPVWATLDVAAAPAAALLVRRAQRDFDESKIPLLGVMGAFVFAAQMINFPVGIGTTGHLVGGALLAYTLGPAPASVVMCAILAIQALVFQDGGVLALGANVLNMAVFGVLAGYLPFYLWGGGKWRRSAIFVGGVFSVLTSAILALAELLLSGVKMPAMVLGISLALFLVSALLEGAITLTVVQALEAIQPNVIQRRTGGLPLLTGAVGAVAVLLGGVGVVFASTAPDGIWKLAAQTGIASRATTLLSTPLSNYHAAFLQGGWLPRASAGIAGIALVYVVCLVMARMAARRRSA